MVYIDYLVQLQPLPNLLINVEPVIILIMFILFLTTILFIIKSKILLLYLLNPFIYLFQINSNHTSTPSFTMPIFQEPNSLFQLF